MPKTPISTTKAPAAVGPYSQGMDAGSLVFTAGQLPIHPETGEISSDIAEQTRQCMENVKAILEAAGTGMDNIVKATIFISDFADFATVNEVYGSYFTANHPARSTVGNVTLARGARVEVEAIALK
jgi:2-iminobutanoate/2-iminopropanoate deaminase